MKRYNPTADILNAIGALDTGDKIRAYFKSGKEAVFSGYMLELLSTDPEIGCITSDETGEILYMPD